jgi:class 3 adenylate cyclase
VLERQLSWLLEHNTVQRIVEHVEGEARDLLQELAPSHGGRVSSCSAMAMLVLPDPAAAGGLEMVEQVQEAGSCRRGWVSHRDRSSSETGDCSGRVVNLAARVMDRARPGQVLATLEVVAVTPREQARFQDLGPVQLKGIATPIELSVAWRPG